MDIHVLRSACCNVTDAATFRQEFLAKLLFKYTLNVALAFVEMRIVCIIFMRSSLRSILFYRLISCRLVGVRSYGDFNRIVRTDFQTLANFA